ncbi:hypothetical protein ACFFJY_08675 [Fictibacillus aquaticus]|uniref:hypothetical protein n=1 Tax=Fictibacillus aquaticus TaxID=2021314 RepID=UPI0013FD5C7A|nr:hypothetical protein [Fictibacillus aquaticus]
MSSYTAATSRILELQKQFEDFTKRSLTEKELRFIEWMAERGALIEQPSTLKKR